MLVISASEPSDWHLMMTCAAQVLPMLVADDTSYQANSQVDTLGDESYTVTTDQVEDKL